MLEHNFLKSYKTWPHGHLLSCPGTPGLHLQIRAGYSALPLPDSHDPQRL